MKPTTLLLAAALACTGPTAHASHDHGVREEGGTYYVDAEVIEVKPIVRIVEIAEPEETCWNETVRREAYPHGYRSRTPLVLGAIIGGVIGHQFGAGRGNDAMTAAGALLGASVGRDAAYRQGRGAAPVYSTEQVCQVSEVTHEEERLEGFRVRYRLDGREFVTRTPFDPGPRLRVRVQVDPAPYN